jgi:hypothetical protein
MERTTRSCNLPEIHSLSSQESLHMSLGDVPKMAKFPFTPILPTHALARPKRLLASTCATSVRPTRNRKMDCPLQEINNERTALGERRSFSTLFAVALTVKHLIDRCHGNSDAAGGAGQR